jgi:hypothetical protein
VLFCHIGCELTELFCKSDAAGWLGRTNSPEHLTQNAWRVSMPIYDEYQIVINEGQRKVIMRALTNAMASDRLSTSKGGTLSRPTHDEYMQLIRLFSTITPSRQK